MKVEIISSEFDDYWYSGLIGDIVEIVVHGNDFVVKEDFDHPLRDEMTWRHIAACDCRVLNVN